MYHGDIRLGDTIDIKFPTRRFTTGAPFTLAGSPVISAYVGNGTTEITAGITLTVDFDSRTGLNNVRVVATSGNGFATATNVHLVITTGTVDSVSVVGEVIGSFSIEARSALMPTTATRTLVVDAAGLADANVVKVGPTGSGTAQTAKDIGGAVPAAAAGASGGLIINGSNSGTVTLAALTISGATSLQAFSCTTITASGAVAFQSTFAVTSTMTVNAFTCTNNFTVSGNWLTTGTTTWTGAAAFSNGLTSAIVGNITGNLSGSVGSVTGAVGSVTGAVGSVTGNVGGNVTGSVGSVTGAVGSVTGNVGGNVVGSVASVSGAVGSVTGNVGGNVTGSVGSLATQAKADVNAEVVDALATDTYAEPGQGAPSATTSLAAKINYVYKAWRNKKSKTATTSNLYADDATTIDQKTVDSDDGTTGTRGEVVSGP